MDKGEEKGSMGDAIERKEIWGMANQEGRRGDREKRRRVEKKDELRKQFRWEVKREVRKRD